ncbi:MAG: hypothetical protein Q8936_25120, partial [Bacillota bacterium]|nr:hypothetical protein [Bacillota bacterium]
MDIGTIKEYYKKGLDYFNQMQFISTWKQAEDFKKGKQWPKATEKTKNMPRPVINIIRYIENYKVSQILSEPISMIFSPRDAEYSQDDTSLVGAEIFTKHSEEEWENVKQDDLNEEALDRASDIGSGIYHYYYDDSVISGLNTIVKGQLKGEILHPINVFVGNPQSLDTQSQPYILITVRDDVKAIRDRAKANGTSVEDLSKIKGDKDTANEGSNNSNFEINDKATEITCYWKENGTAWLMKICGDVVTKEPVDTGHTLYPIARMNWYKDDKNWYGYGDTTDLIPNQKSINFITAMRMMAEQYGGMPKLMLKKGMIDNFSNDPSVPIVDNSSVGWS